MDDIAEAEARVEFYADTVGAHVPRRLLDEFGAPSQEFLRWCTKHGAPLDWIFLGDLTPFVRATYRAARKS